MKILFLLTSLLSLNSFADTIPQERRQAATDLLGRQKVELDERRQQDETSPGYKQISFWVSEIEGDATAIANKFVGELKAESSEIDAKVVYRQVSNDILVYNKKPEDTFEAVMEKWGACNIVEEQACQDLLNYFNGVSQWQETDEIKDGEWRILGKRYIVVVEVYSADLSKTTTKYEKKDQNCGVAEYSDTVETIPAALAKVRAPYLQYIFSGMYMSNDCYTSTYKEIIK